MLEFITKQNKNEDLVEQFNVYVNGRIVGGVDIYDPNDEAFSEEERKDVAKNPVQLILDCHDKVIRPMNFPSLDSVKKFLEYLFYIL